MGTFGYETTTSAPPERAVAFLADLRNLELWVGEVAGVDADGDRYTVRFSRGFFLPDLVVDYTVSRDGPTIVATGTSSSMDVVDRWDVTPSDGGSAIRYDGTYELKGVNKLAAPFAQFMGDVRAKGLARSLAKHLDAAGEPPLTPT
jgi:carbon monoxide dehydrogenase subunit G